MQMLTGRETEGPGCPVCGEMTRTLPGPCEQRLAVPDVRDRRHVVGTQRISLILISKANSALLEDGCAVPAEVLAPSRRRVRQPVCKTFPWCKRDHGDRIHAPLLT